MLPTQRSCPRFLGQPLHHQERSASALHMNTSHHHLNNLNCKPLYSCISLFSAEPAIFNLWRKLSRKPAHFKMEFEFSPRAVYSLAIAAGHMVGAVVLTLVLGRVKRLPTVDWLVLLWLCYDVIVHVTLVRVRSRYACKPHLFYVITQF